MCHVLLIFVALWICQYVSLAVDTSGETHFHNNNYYRSSTVEVFPTVESSAVSSSLRDCILPGNITQCQRRFPSNLATDGGLVFFLHIPKTGGTTLRLNLESYDHINYIFAKNYSTYWDTAPIVEDAIARGRTLNKSILFYEIHATTAPSFFRLRHRLRRWKEAATHNHFPVFFFTVLRDPISYAFSHFNFFHIQRRNPTFEQCNATEENFVRLTLYNPQCQFLFEGEPSMRAQKPKNKVVQKGDCEAIQHHMLELLDWVGTLETLTDQTLPMLSHLLGLPQSHQWTNHRISKNSRYTYFGRDNVTEETLQWVETEMSLMDRELYNMAQQEQHQCPESFTLCQ